MFISQSDYAIFARSIVFLTNQSSLFQLFYCLLTNQSFLFLHCFFFCLVANQVPLFCPPGLVFVLQKDGGFSSLVCVVERRGVETIQFDFLLFIQAILLYVQFNVYSICRGDCFQSGFVLARCFKQRVNKRKKKFP